MNLAAIGAFSLAVAVGLGAFGAHGLKNHLDAYLMGVWEKAVFYHFIHTVMLFVLAHRQPVPRGPWLSFFVGIVIFSGTLYLLAVTNVRWLGAITPIGGICLIVGWAWLLATAGNRPAAGGQEKT